MMFLKDFVDFFDDVKVKIKGVLFLVRWSCFFC